MEDGRWRVSHVVCVCVCVCVRACVCALQGDGFLVNKIVDQTGSKGTGKWTVQQAAELMVAAPTITASLDGRYLSAIKPERVAASKVGLHAYLVIGEPGKTTHDCPGTQLPRLCGRGTSLRLQPTLCVCVCVCVQVFESLGLSAPGPLSGVDKKQLVEDVKAALYASKICSYAQVCMYHSHAHVQCTRTCATHSWISKGPQTRHAFRPQLPAVRRGATQMPVRLVR